MNTNKKMYKVLSPIEKKPGNTYWMRVGSAFTNKDESINLYIDAMPAPNGKSYQFQIRELDAEDLRRRDAARDGRDGRGTGDGASAGASESSSTGYSGNSYSGNGYSGNSYSGNGYNAGTDLGAIGSGGPASRAVTSHAPRSGDDIPF